MDVIGIIVGTLIIGFALKFLLNSDNSLKENSPKWEDISLKVINSKKIKKT